MVVSARLVCLSAEAEGKYTLAQRASASLEGISDLSIGAKTMTIDADFTVGFFDVNLGTGISIAVHEIMAHAFGARDYNEDNKNTYAYELGFKGWGFTEGQGRTILSHLQKGNLNRGTSIHKERGATLPNLTYFKSNKKNGSIQRAGFNVRKMLRRLKK